MPAVIQLPLPVVTFGASVVRWPGLAIVRPVRPQAWVILTSAHAFAFNQLNLGDRLLDEFVMISHFSHAILSDHGR